MMFLQKGKTPQQQFAPPMPPYPYPPPMRRRKKKRKKEEKKEDPPSESVPAEPSAAQIAAMEAAQNVSPSNGNGLESNLPDEDPNVLKSEIDDIRKSIVSMSVGQPVKTSTIVKEWLEQPAPEISEPQEEASKDDDGDEENTEE